MSAITKSRTNIFAAIRRLFSSDIDVEEYEDVKLPEELKDVLNSMANKELAVEQAINVDNKSSKGGFTKKINAKTEKAMRAMYEEASNKTTKKAVEKERE